MKAFEEIRVEAKLRGKVDIGVFRCVSGRAVLILEAQGAHIDSANEAKKYVSSVIPFGGHTAETERVFVEFWGKYVFCRHCGRIWYPSRPDTPRRCPGCGSVNWFRRSKPDDPGPKPVYPVEE